MSSFLPRKCSLTDRRVLGVPSLGASLIWAPLVWACVLTVFLALSGCASSPEGGTTASLSLGGDFSTPIGLSIDNFVRRQKPALYVSPRHPLGYRPKALLVPFRVRQQMANANALGTMLSQQVWQIWLSQHGFDVLEFAPEAGPYEPQRAMAIARQRGAEFVVGGYVNHYVDGGSGGESSLSLALEIYDVKNGVMLWSMAQGGLMEARQVHDFYLFTVRERNPADPAGLIIRTLAWDMGKEVLLWIDPTTREKSFMESMGRKGF